MIERLCRVVDRWAAEWLEWRLGPDQEDGSFDQIVVTPFDQQCVEYVETSSYGVIQSDDHHAAAFVCQDRLH